MLYFGSASGLESLSTQMIKQAKSLMHLCLQFIQNNLTEADSRFLVNLFEASLQKYQETSWG